MPHRKHSQPSKGPVPDAALQAGLPFAGAGKKRLDLVLKCDSMGSVEAVSAVISDLKMADAEIKLIHAGVGTISKQDLLMALSGSKLVLGFQVGIAPKMEQLIKENGVEIRLYNVIYKLVEDLREIGRSLVPPEPDEKVTGTCRVIAVFKSSKGVVLGCEVEEGTLQVGKAFRVVAAMGPVLSSRIESMQVEKKPVREARPGQQVGVKVGDFQGAKVGDFIEVFETSTPKKKMWSPQGRIIHLEAS
jgi:translation initiation factor IF-2